MPACGIVYQNQQLKNTKPNYFTANYSGFFAIYFYLFQIKIFFIYLYINILI